MANYEINKMRKAVNDFAFRSKPSNSNGNSECKVEDINKVIKNISKMMNQIIDELDSATD